MFLRSLALVNLSFLRNLTRIGPSTMDVHRFAVYIVYNTNLKELWSRPDHENRTHIVNGSVSVYGNAMLCAAEIKRWQLYTLKHNISRDLIDFEANGYEATCQYENLQTNAVVHSYRHATVQWERFPLTEGQTLFGYYVYYIEAPHPNVTYTMGMDSCGM